MNTLEDWAYGKVGEELMTNMLDKAIWAKAFVQAGGDDKKTRVLYIKLRVAKLMQLEIAKHNEREAAKRTQEEAVRLATKKSELEWFKMLERVRNAKQILQGKSIRDITDLELSAEGKEFLNLCSQGNLDKVKNAIASNEMLLAIVDSAGNTGLHHAVASGKTEIIKFLVDRGMNPQIQNREGKTPLEMARQQRMSVAAYLNP